MSNYHYAKQQAKLAGFSKLLGTDKKEFLLLSDKTDGRAGRYVFINSNLANIFLSFVSKDKHNIILNRMEQLRATAGGMQSYSNVKSAFEHFSTILDFQIGYKIVQSTGSQEHKPGVYITSMKVSEISGQQSGFYDVKCKKDVWEINSNKGGESINSSYAAINGLTEHLEMAASTIIPPMIEKAYSDRKWGHEAVRSTGYSLLYNPPVLYDDNIEWKTPAQKTQGKDFTANLLSQAMIKAQQSGKKIKWVVHGDGAKVFHQAIQRLQGKNMSNHTFLFAAPSEDMTKILPLMRQSKMNLHDDVMVYQEDDWSQAGNRTNKSIGKEVSKFGGDFTSKGFNMQDDAGKTKNDLRGKYVNAAGFSGLLKNASAGFGLTAAIGTVAGAGGAPLMTAAAVASAAYVGAKALIDIKGMQYSTQSLRNTAMQKVVDQNLNPHLNPYATRAQMNASYKQHSGGRVKTFAAIIKSLGK